jgi:RNA polymerase sigma factor (sigma-70 family)
MAKQSDLDAMSDEALLSRLSELPQAAAVLRKRYQRRLTQFLRGEFPRIDAEGVARETITTCLLAYSRNAIRVSFAAALYTAARNAGRAAQIQADVRAEVSLEASALADVLPSLDGNLEAIVIERVALEQALDEALSCLTSWQQQLFCWHHVQHISIRQIAITLGTTESAVKSSIHHAVRRLRQHPALAPWRQD